MNLNSWTLADEKRRSLVLLMQLTCKSFDSGYGVRFRTAQGSFVFTVNSNGGIMRFSDLPDKYDMRELCCFQKDNGIKYNAISPFFNDLYENMIIYREKFNVVIHLSDLSVTPTGLSATATPVYWIEPPPDSVLVKNIKPWSFGSPWDFMALSLESHSLSCPYAGFTLYPEKDLVKVVCMLCEIGDLGTAYKCLNFSRYTEDKHRKN